ncbi:MAG: hypothetical protein HY042_05135 [Spirochaetia bacterium]|nr:hypothetical protein [Spirochaetia bacterium]
MEMVVVIAVIGLLLGVMASIGSNIALLKTSTDEAEILRDSLVFSSRAALKSNQIVYFEININDNSYRAYRMDRSEATAKENELLKPHSLSVFNGIVAVATATGNRISSGKVTVPFSPDGTGEELAIYIGNKPSISATVLYSKYGSDARVEKKEVTKTLENPGWKENVEEF